MDAIIQNRRGDYSDVIPENLRPGEYVIVQQNDPNSTSGQSVYVGIKSGVVKRLAFSSEVEDYNIQAQQAAQQAQQAQAQTATIAGQVNTKAEQVSTNAQAAASSATAAQTAAQTATTKAGEAAQSKTDAQTASQTTVNVLDSMAPEYSSSKTYAVGDLVIHDNQLYECSTAITTAEAWNASHWTVSTVENQITDLKEDLGVLEVEYSDASLWESGGITAAAGEDSQNGNRIRTGYISRAINRVNPANGYKVAIYAYSSSGVYIGIYNGNGYQTNALYWYTSTVNLNRIPSEYKIRIAVAKEPDGQMAVEDGLNILFESFTDKSLTQSGKAADAKAVGDAISAIEPGLSDEAKTALLNCFEHVAWINEHGQDYYDELYEALYGYIPERWDYEWDASSGVVPIGKDNVSYPGSFSNGLFVLTNPQSAYVFPIANDGEIKVEIEFNIVSISSSDWWPLFNFALSATNGFYAGRTGTGLIRSNITGSYKTYTNFPVAGSLHKLTAILKSNGGCSFSFDDIVIDSGAGGVHPSGVTNTGIYLVPSNTNALGLKSVKYKYLSNPEPVNEIVHVIGYIEGGTINGISNVAVIDQPFDSYTVFGYSNGAHKLVQKTTGNELNIYPIPIPNGATGVTITYATPNSAKYRFDVLKSHSENSNYYSIAKYGSYIASGSSQDFSSTSEIANRWGIITVDKNSQYVSNIQIDFS